jgi:hypothetical protein
MVFFNIESKRSVPEPIFHRDFLCYCLGNPEADKCINCWKSKEFQLYFNHEGPLL